MAIAVRAGTGNAAKRVRTTAPGPWTRWKGSLAGQAIRFIETYCAAPKGVGHGQPLKLGTFQRDFIEAILADQVDAAVLTTPRGNGKSTFGGALATWAVFADTETGAPQVPIIATTVSQAIRSCYGVASAMIQVESELDDRAITYTGIGTARVFVPSSGGELFPIANEPDGLQGLDYSLAIADEIGFQPMESWDSLRMAAGKRSRSLLVGVGTHGLTRDNALAQLIKDTDAGVQLPGFIIHDYAAPPNSAIDDRDAWYAASPALRDGFLRESAYETDLAMVRKGKLPEAHFRIFRLNQPWEGTDAWLGPDGYQVWTGLVQPYQLAPRAAVWVGVDAALTRDSTAVVWVAVDDQGEYHARSRVWAPGKDTPVDMTDVMQHIRDLGAQYELQAVSYDPRYFDVPAKMLSDDGYPMVEVPQSVERMTPAIGSLYELIKQGKLHHDGDEVLTTHVLNAVPRFNERGFTLQKAKSRGKIDACIALALAVERALRTEVPKEPLFAWA